MTSKYEHISKRFLVTGCSSGIGRELVKEMVRRGDLVWGVSRNKTLLNDLKSELSSERFFYSACDVRVEHDVKTAFDSMAVAGFLPDVIFLNAGVNPERFGTPFTLTEYKDVFEVNLFGALRWVESFLPLFRERGSGQFVAISSLAAYWGDARWVAYSASKAALDRSFESFRCRHAGEGLIFTTVHLGAVRTGMGVTSRSPFCLSPRRAVLSILDAAERGVRSVTVPALLRIILHMILLLPESFSAKMLMKTSSPPKN